jgi:hypothetical protein
VSVKRQQKPIDSKDLGRWRLIADFQQRLRLLSERMEVAATFADPKRQLQLEEYLGLFLFGLLNPVVRTMRALCRASHQQRVREDVCGRPVSLGSFSEMQAVVDPALLQAAFCELVEEINPRSQGKTPAKEWLIVDSTLWEVLPRMHWALWRHQHKAQSAVRLHVGLHLLDDKPAKVMVTTGRTCERKAWRELWEPGDAYVGDRYYGAEYKLFGELDALGCSFVLRLHNEVFIDIEEELHLGELDRKANVIRQAWVYLGARKAYRSMRVRVVWVQTPKEVLLLVTNQSPEQLGGDLVAELYRRRWQVELFFRWIKCILGNRHWLAESPQGVSIQIYLALIGALLLQGRIGQRPNKRMFEAIQLYLMGMATLEGLEAEIEYQLARIAAAKNKNRQ